MDQPKIERLLRLMKMLTAPRSYTIEELGERLEMSPRTVYRYIDTFKGAGFVVKKEGDCFKLDKTSPYFKDISELVHFTKEEAYILEQAIESIDQNNVMKQNLRAKLASVYDHKMMVETVVKGSTARNVNAIVEAIREKKQIVLHNYRSGNSRSISDRIVEPYEFTTNYIQLWAYETGSRTNKIFKVSRIGKVEVLERDWEFETAHKAGIMDLFRYTGYDRLPVKLRLGMRAASLLVEEYPLAEREMTKEEDARGEIRYMLETNVTSYLGVGRFVLGLLDDIEILESEEFREFLRRRIADARI